VLPIAHGMDEGLAREAVALLLIDCEEDRVIRGVANRHVARG
jgi:hypothetical protein